MAKAEKAKPIEERLQGQTAVLGGSIDFAALDKALAAIDPRLAVAARLYLGVDNDGSRNEKQLSQQEAARQAGMGENNHAVVSKALKALGVDKTARNRFWASSAAAPAISDGESRIDAAPRGDDTGDATILEDIETGAEADTTRRLSDETGEYDGGADPTLAQAGFGEIGNVGQSQGRVESAGTGLITAQKWYGVVNQKKGLSSLTTAELGEVAARASQYATNPNAQNAAALRAIMDEIAKRSRTPGIAREIALAYNKVYGGTSTAEANEEAANEAEAVDQEQAESYRGLDGREERADSAEGLSDTGGAYYGQESTGVASSVRSDKPAPVVSTKKRRTVQRIENDNVIDVEARVVEDEVLTGAVAALPAPNVETLEQHYGAKADSPEFRSKLREDLAKFAKDGISAVSAKIGHIIKKAYAALMAAGIAIFNPATITSVEGFLFTPTADAKVLGTLRDTGEVREVRATVPAEVEGMSDAAREAYSVLIPALKSKIGDKLITIADKPSGRVFVFKPDGSLVVQKKVLYGLAKGDLYVGNNDLPQNRVTPAGLFGLKLVDAAKGGGAKRTAGDYDFGKVFALEDPDAVVTIMHSVWLKEKDAPKRQAALNSNDPADSRYSFGCINIDKATYKFLLDNYEQQMDGSKMFVVPDNQAAVRDFLAGNVADDRLVREGVQPATEKVMRRFGQQPNSATVANPYTAKQLLAELKAFMRSDITERKLLVFDTIDDALKHPDTNVKTAAFEMRQVGAYGVASDGRAILIADRISKGQGRAKFMHEVGAHLGLSKLLSPDLYDSLATRIFEWAGQDANSLERELAVKAITRVRQANEARPKAAKMTAEEKKDEVIAYFIEEAMLKGIDPRAANKLTGPLREWFRSLWAAFKTVARKLGMKPEALTAQDVVDMAYGAAQVELGGNVTSPAFTKWFGKSQIVDEDGKPKVMYHGTARDIEEFKRGVAGAIFVSPDPNFTNSYSVGREGGNVMQLYVRAEKPFDQDNPAHVTELLRKLEATPTSEWGVKMDGFDGGVAEALRNARVLLTDDTFKIRPEGWKFLEASGVQKAIQSLKYDGFYVYENGTKNLAVYNPNQLKSATGNNGAYSRTDNRVRFGQNAPSPVINKLPEPLQKPVGDVATVVSRAMSSGLNKVVFMHDLLDRAAKMKLGAAAKLKDAYAKRKTMQFGLNRRVEDVARLYGEVPVNERGIGPGSVNDLVKRSTLSDKWAYGDKADPELAREFSKLSPQSQAYMKAVFDHGDKTLKEKKAIIERATTGLYNQMIDAAKKAGDNARVSELEETKAKLLRKFERLFSLRGDKPYAPIKRFGDHVVIGESAELAALRKAGDTKRVAELERDPEHYQVDFYESERAALQGARELQAQRPNLKVISREKEKARARLYGGDGMAAAFTKLRSQVDAFIEAEKVGTDAKENASRRLVIDMVNDLYLNAMAEDSARMSEQRRRGIPGNVDMMRSFVQQGYADAHMMTAMAFSKTESDAINEMREQLRDMTDQKVASGVFNEILQRAANANEYREPNLLDKIKGAASFYHLLVSPMYYVQNLTQPWLVSAPIIGGRHGAGAATKAMYKGMEDVAGAWYKAGFGMALDTTKAPADVRQMLTELYESGDLTSGMAREAQRTEAATRGKVRQAGDFIVNFLDDAQMKVEALNRAATAVAAYRLELAKNGGNAEAAKAYARQMILETHGDYSSLAAPRMFDSNVGKLALQFRKYQLLQLSLLGKLTRDVIQGNDRKTALRALGFVLTQAFAVGGLMALPGATAIGWALGKLFADEGESEEPEYQLRAWMRKQGIDKETADLLVKGVFYRAAGVDMSKFGWSNALSVMPFTDIDFSRRGVQEMVFALATGASGGMALKVADGAAELADGNVLKGLSRAAPGVLGSVPRGVMQATEGMKNRDGEVLLPADEINAVEAVLTALGGTPAVVSRQNFINNVNADFRKEGTDAAASIQKAYREARDAGEPTGEIIDRWLQLQQTRSASGFERKTVSDLMDSYRNSKKQERNTVNGIQYTPSTRRFAQQLGEL